MSIGVRKTVLFFDSILRLIRDFRRINMKPPQAIMLQSRDDGRVFEQYCRREWGSTVDFTDAEKLARGPSLLMIGDTGWGYVEVYGIKVMWPAEKRALPGERGQPLDFQWLY